MPSSWVPEIATYLIAHPQVDAGIHVALGSVSKNYRWGPVACRCVVPGLVDEDGYLLSGSDGPAHATADQIETEIRAQIDRAISMGIVPTHIDSSGAIHFSPQYINSFVKVAIERKLPLFIPGGHMQHFAEQETNRDKTLILSAAQKLWESGLPVIDDIVPMMSRADTYEKRKAEWIALLREMKSGITEIIVHPTVQAEELSAMSDRGPDLVEADLRMMTDPDIKEFIKSEGIVLTTWRELKERRAQIK
jgi:hypothetical protein